MFIQQTTGLRQVSHYLAVSKIVSSNFRSNSSYILTNTFVTLTFLIKKLIIFHKYISLVKSPTHQDS